MRLSSLFVFGAVLGSLFTGINPANAQGTAFTYQGQLQNNGGPANGSYDLTFALFDTNSIGTQQGVTLTNTATAVSNGLFTVTLDFGNQFPGANRWLEIGVRTNGSGVFATLAPRQQLTASPYAVQALNASVAATASSVPATNLTGTLPLARLPAPVVTNTETGVTLSGTFSGTGTGLTVTAPTSTNYVFAYDTTTQSLSSTAFANITFNSNGQISGWSHTTGTATFICTQTGIYLVEYHVQPASANAGDVMTVRATLNGLEISGSAAGHTVFGGDTEPEITKSFIASIPSGTTLSFQISDSTSPTGGSIAPAGTATTKTSASCAIIRIQ